MNYLGFCISEVYANWSSENVVNWLDKNSGYMKRDRNSSTLERNCRSVWLRLPSRAVDNCISPEGPERSFGGLGARNFWACRVLSRISQRFPKLTHGNSNSSAKLAGIANCSRVSKGNDSFLSFLFHVCQFPSILCAFDLVSSMTKQKTTPKVHKDQTKSGKISILLTSGKHDITTAFLTVSLYNMQIERVAWVYRSIHRISRFRESGSDSTSR